MRGPLVVAALLAATALLAPVAHTQEAEAPRVTLGKGWKITYGQRFKLRGTAQPDAGPVRILAVRNGREILVASPEADADGRYSAFVRPRRSTTYVSEQAGARSATSRVLVAGRVRLEQPAVGGGVLRFSGSVSPARGRIALHRGVGCGGDVIARQTVRARRYSFTVARARGRYSVIFTPGRGVEPDRSEQRAVDLDPRVGVCHQNLDDEV